MKGWTLAFDLDGTLIDTAPDLIGATNFVMRELGLDAVGEADLRPRISYGSRHLIETGLKLHGVAKSEAEVNAFYEAAMAAGATDNGKPGARLYYDPRYYAADVFDPDGYSIEAVYKSWQHPQS